MGTPTNYKIVKEIMKFQKEQSMYHCTQRTLTKLTFSCFIDNTFPQVFPLDKDHSTNLCQINSLEVGAIE